MIGQLLNGYEIVGKIKDGSVGSVWKALSPKGQTVALKQISAANGAISEKVRQFRKEATLTQKLAHRGIIRVLEYLEHPRQPCFAMEYFESENLKFAMWHQPERVHKYEFRILRQIAEALLFTHDQGVIHKDLKPENVLINERSETRLIDFSLAQGKMDRFLQFVKRVEGTPLYMAPEQIQGVKCDPRSDIYSFGVLMYELLTKRPPFLGTTEANLLEKHLKEPPPPMQTFVKTLSSELDAVVLKMLSKRREDRFQDMSSILVELARWEKKNTVIRLRQVEPVRPRPAEAGR
jgi:serine/threonine-protein kinase